MPNYLMVFASQETLDKVILVNHIVALLLVEVSQNMRSLLPEVHGFLIFHLSLHVQDVGHLQTIHKPLPFEFLSNLGLDVRNWHVQLVQFCEFFGTSDVFTIQMQDTQSHLSASS